MISNIQNLVQLD